MAKISAGTSGHGPHADISRWRSAGGVSTLDELQVTHLKLLPEVRLHLAGDAIILWARLEAEAKSTVPAPFWASAWAGGQALGRYLLDHPEVVRGKRVLDLGSGSGLAAIAAAMAGAAAVTANDIDPHALAVIHANARLNHVRVSTLSGDLLHHDAGDPRVRDFDVVMTGDGLYSRHLAVEMLRFLRQADERGAEVIVGDPDRGHLPHSDVRLLATYPIEQRALADLQIKTASVYRLGGPAAVEG
jgi:predicted nicotinamide N-methyase